MLKERLIEFLTDMSGQNKELSMRLYGKKIMCVIPKDISPTHKIFSTCEDEEILNIISGKNENKSLILFPEHHLSPSERVNFLNYFLQSEYVQEVIIITTDSFIASDFISELSFMMTLNESGEIQLHPVNEKLLMINIHAFYRKVMGVQSLSGKVSHKIVQELIDITWSKETLSDQVYERAKRDAEFIGERVMRSKLLEQLEEKYLKDKPLRNPDTFYK